MRRLYLKNTKIEMFYLSMRKNIFGRNLGKRLMIRLVPTLEQGTRTTLATLNVSLVIVAFFGRVESIRLMRVIGLVGIVINIVGMKIMFTEDVHIAMRAINNVINKCSQYL
jgi:hypothetical protein